jgi:segregation and condensation protein B
VVGRPVLYKTTKEFLIQFGLKDLAELPSLKEFEEWSRLAIGEPEPEPPPQAQPEAATEPVVEPVAPETEPAPEASPDA